ncbi:uncharacterized protein METZ01_LOCUS193884, partial [marine metagenome]
MHNNIPNDIIDDLYIVIIVGYCLIICKVKYEIPVLVTNTIYYNAVVFLV